MWYMPIGMRMIENGLKAWTKATVERLQQRLLLTTKACTLIWASAKHNFFFIDKSVCMIRCKMRSRKYLSVRCVTTRDLTRDEIWDLFHESDTIVVWCKVFVSKNIFTESTRGKLILFFVRNNFLSTERLKIAPNLRTCIDRAQASKHVEI